MKHTLKNRPNWTYYPGFRTYREAVMKWFEGFEQELRDKIEPRKADALASTIGRNALIREILGEEASS